MKTNNSPNNFFSNSVSEPLFGELFGKMRVKNGEEKPLAFLENKKGFSGQATGKMTKLMKGVDDGTDGGFESVIFSTFFYFEALSEDLCEFPIQEIRTRSYSNPRQLAILIKYLVRPPKQNVLNGKKSENTAIEKGQGTENTVKKNELNDMTQMLGKEAKINNSIQSVRNTLNTEDVSTFLPDLKIANEHAVRGVNPGDMLTGDEQQRKTVMDSYQMHRQYYFDIMATLKRIESVLV